MANWFHDWFGAPAWHRDWFGTVAAPEIPGSGPDPAAVFSFDFENSYRVTYRWPTNVIKTYSGKEQRISRNDRPLESYEGSALMFGTQAAEIRAQLARHAAAGMSFSLGLPHEEMSFRADAAGSTVYVHSTTASDWMNPGQRVIVKRLLDSEVWTSVEGVIQSVAPASITLDVAPGVAGNIGGVIMPTMPILLDPEQAFPRFATEVERWELRARAKSFDFARKLATLALGPLTSHVGLDNATVTERYPGACESFQMANTGFDGLGELDETTADAVFLFVSAGFLITTVDDLYNKLAASTRLAPTGTWVLGGGNLTAGDSFAAADLAGGETAGPMGTGAVLTTYLTRPVWTPDLENDSTITDSIHAMTEILDYGGVPDAIGTADHPDWGRTVAYTGLHGPDWQWFKLFMVTVVGGQKAFWLSTHRDDLPFVSKAAGVVTVEADVSAWWPAQRQHVEIKETSGTVTRAQVTAAVDNGDGTWTLTIGTTLASAAVERVSWLELARWTRDEVSVMFDEEGFHVEMTATVVQR